MPPEDPRFARVLGYLRGITDEAGLATDYAAEGDVIRPAPRC